MTEAEKLAETFAAARRHPGYRQAMQTPAVTWLTTAIVIVIVMAASISLTLAIYPWDNLDRMPPPIKAMMMFSWVPTLGAVVASAWLLFDAAGLAVRPGAWRLTVIRHREAGPAPYFIRLVDEQGVEQEYRARRRAASSVKLGLLTPGDVGVAVFKGDLCVEWVPLPVHPDRSYDRA